MSIYTDWRCFLSFRHGGGGRGGMCFGLLDTVFTTEMQLML
jgi:hypothetical protein